MPRPRLLNTAQTAEVLGCSLSTVLRMVASGSLTPIQKFPGRTGALVFDEDDVLRARRERERAPAA